MSESDTFLAHLGIGWPPLVCNLILKSNHEGPLHGLRQYALLQLLCYDQLVYKVLRRQKGYDHSKVKLIQWIL